MKEHAPEDPDCIQLGELPLFGDPLKQLSALRELECEVVLGARLEPFVELDLSKCQTFSTTTANDNDA